MPESIAVWIVLIVAVALVVGLIVWLGRGGSFEKDGLKLKLDRPQTPGPRVEVADNLDAKGGRLGNITGVETAGSLDSATASEISVAKNVRLRNAEVGDITGVKISGGGQQGKQ
jgi:hypothetical protein